MSEAEALLRRLGATANYLGFRYLIFAVEMTMRDESCLLMAYKGMYMEIASHFDTNVRSVEHAMRTVINVCWKYESKKMFTEMSGRELEEKPSTTEFIDLAASYLKNGQSRAKEVKRIFRISRAVL